MNKEKSEVLTNEKVKTVSPMRKKLSGIAAVSFFIAVFDRLGELIYNALVHGFFGTIFTSYSYLQKKIQGEPFGKASFWQSCTEKILKKS